MTIPSLPAAGSFNVAAGSNASRATLIEQWLSAIAAMPGAGLEEALVVSSNSITPSKAMLRVDTGGSAQVNLDTVSTAGQPQGAIIGISIADPSRKVNVRNAVGNLVLAYGTCLLSSSWSKIWLQLRGSSWAEVQRFYAPNDAEARTYMGLAAGATASFASDAEAQAGTDTTKIICANSMRAALNHAGRMIDGKSVASGLTAGDYFLLSRAGALYRINILDLLAPSFAGYTEIAEVSLAQNTSQIAAHSLTVKPKLVWGFLRCKTAEGGHNVGEEVSVDCLVNDGAARTINYGADAVNYWVRVANVGAQVRMLVRGTGAFTNITAANWRFCMRMWA